MIVLVIILAVIAVATFLLARRRTREALRERRRADELQQQVDVWVEAEQQGLGPPRERDDAQRSS
jgi:hypothetical protein